MNHSLKLLLAVASAGLSACALAPLPHEPVAHKISVNGESHLLTQITDSTWTARIEGNMKTLATTPASTSALRLAVEQTSGCKVTDSDYSRQGRQFDAQVNCDSKLAN
ncbi:MAG: hypothetical protein ABIR56_17065 [Polaromonas sp.]